MKVNDIPCGSCMCGTYSIGASLNKNARKFGALEEKERLDKIPICNKNKDKLCAGAYDFHCALVKLDKDIDEDSKSMEVPW